MLTTADKKWLRRLRRKKHRQQERSFVAEGPRVVRDLLEAGLRPRGLWSTAPAQWPAAKSVSPRELEQLSQLQTAHEVIAVFPYLNTQAGPSHRVLILDGVQDPGNVGSLLRTADWFGFSHIWATPNTADAYNPKVVQSTMGSLARVQIHYAEAETIAAELADRPWYVAHLEGAALPAVEQLPPRLALVMGSEAHGPRESWRQAGTPLALPRRSGTAIDSLNVAVAGGIFMHHLSGGAAAAAASP
jgi:TrmH family RNA methyltransferase